MASNNHDELKENGGKRSNNNGMCGKLSSSCNESADPTQKVTSKVGFEKSSKSSNVKSKVGKLRRGKNSVGTLDQAIRKRNIFTAVAKMPTEIQTRLIENGWIGKIMVADDCFRRNGEYLPLD